MDELKTFFTLAIGVIVEAYPFLILGSIIAVILEKYAIIDLLLRKSPHSSFFRRPMFALLGFAMPVCECGNIPVARTMLLRGASIGEATTFLLAAPILNPITLFTTVEAFRGTPWVSASRIIGGFTVAIIVGIIIGKIRNPLTKSFAKSCIASTRSKEPLSVRFIKTLWPLTKLLIVGALVAALVQVVVDQNILSGLSQNYLAGVIIMLIFSFIIAICSNIDAFFALGFVGSVRLGAITTFLIAGPMVDIKMIIMLKETYNTKTLLILSSLVAILSGCIGWGLSYVG